MDLITAPPELGYDVFGKEFSIAAGSVNFGILSKQTVEDGLEVTKQGIPFGRCQERLGVWA